MKNLIFLLILSALTFVGCGDDEATSLPNSSTTAITISGQIATGLTGDGNVSELNSIRGLEEYTFYCVAFNASADSCSDQLDTEGNFSCAGLPSDTPFGCFVKDATSIVATLEFTDTTSTGFENETASSASVKESVSLGAVVLNTATGKATVSKSVLDGKTSTGSSDLTPLDFQGTSWTLSCVDGDDSAMNTVCSQFVTESPTVYFRILAATKGSTTMYGLGVWENASAYAGCGSIDMTTDMKEAIESEDSITFTTINHDTAFTNDHGGSGTCPTWDNSAPTEYNDINNYYALEKLIDNGGSYTMYQEDEDSYSGCTYTHTLSVTFNPSSDTVMYGAFDIVEKESGSSCPSEEFSAKFTVKFTKSE